MGVLEVVLGASRALVVFFTGSAVGVHLIFLLQIYTCMLHTFYILLIFYNLSKTQWAGGRCLLVHLAPCKEYLPLEPACLRWSSHPGPCWLLWPVRPRSELALKGLMSHLRASGAQWAGHTEEQEMSWADLLRRTREQGQPRAVLGILETRAGIRNLALGGGDFILILLLSKHSNDDHDNDDDDY